MDKLFKSLIVMCAVFMLSGCLYPQSERAKNDAPKEDQVLIVQNAVDTFQESNDGILPIKTLSDQREYLEHQIDFGRLALYLSEIPTTAYENGGYYQYVIIDAEEDPKVKVADLRITEEVRSLTTRLNILGDNVKLGEMIGPNVYQLDLDAYHLKDNPTVESPFTGRDLNVFYNGGREFIIDYREDAQKIIDDNDLKYKTGEDVRSVFYEYTEVVPLYSPELTVDDNNKVIFMTSKHKEK
ncbi:hypothetical protein GCM10007358_02730 [Phocicoccus schoeneichii]|uniref:Lipoprotein n=1 Tax=Phocicoccus schoeneichii TaxID=1812261 RepID=A0A6V7RHE9_9BACL|nr:hypothetical protein [Jeotgalicoccus schoeneichii]GGH47733.1 hypothetical protein GCM10007358_02730 [Jeotgalicoccus schoeneichii]CAD2077349.1 hypothetical protein JEOSCH030_01280 [Jeotgalicoccus schoeneichii]